MDLCSPPYSDLVELIAMRDKLDLVQQITFNGSSILPWHSLTFSPASSANDLADVKISLRFALRATRLWRIAFVLVLQSALFFACSTACYVH
jgi:hypothetical protein